MVTKERMVLFLFVICSIALVMADDTTVDTTNSTKEERWAFTEPSTTHGAYEEGFDGFIPVAVSPNPDWSDGQIVYYIGRQKFYSTLSGDAIPNGASTTSEPVKTVFVANEEQNDIGPEPDVVELYSKPPKTIFLESQVPFWERIPEVSANETHIIVENTMNYPMTFMGTTISPEETAAFPWEKVILSAVATA